MADLRIALCAVGISGCVLVPGGTLYVPVNATDAERLLWCASPPRASFKRKIGDGLTLTVSITESGSGPLQLLIEGFVERGTVARFLGSGVEVSSTDGISHFELLSSGFMQLPQRFDLLGITSRPESIVVSLPAVIVNGSSIEIESITFKPEERLGMKCVSA